VARKAFNLAPTVRALPSGAPSVPLINLAARAPADPHAHGHGPAPRSEAPPSWAGGVALSAAGHVSRTLFNGAYPFSPSPFLS
jgi:ubiquinol-cytochrome c reductase iron-sulfur subunit